MPQLSYLVDAIIIAFAGYFLFGRSYFRKKCVPYPPGPRPLPLLGNLLDLPIAGEQEWLFWGRHKDLYGPISSIEIFGRRIVVINKADIAFDLFEKHYKNYSDRPQMIFGNEIVGYKESPPNLNYTPLLREHRKQYHRLVGTKASCSKFESLISIEIRRSLLQVLENTKSLQSNIRDTTGSIILRMTYGYIAEVLKPDPAINLAEELLIQFSNSIQPGRWLVDYVPALRYIPEWFPGVKFKRIARAYREVLKQSVERPFAFTKLQMELGSGRPSFVSTLLEDLGRSPSLEEERVMKWTALAFYGAGSDTSVSAVMTFYLAMALFPEVQRRAQGEIDAVIGDDRFPVLEDRKSLPYVDALVKETLRWHPVVPLCVPHAVAHDNVYNGYFIPKGSVVMPNIWGFTHDPEVYHDPMIFRPERFLKSEGHTPEPDPRLLIFGFGRRICPGRELADASLYLSIAMTLSVFEIAVPKNSDLKPQFKAAMISHPEEFEVDVIPRSAKADSMIRSIEVEHSLDTSDSMTFEGIVI